MDGVFPVGISGVLAGLSPLLIPFGSNLPVKKKVHKL